MPHDPPQHSAPLKCTCKFHKIVTQSIKGSLFDCNIQEITSARRPHLEQITPCDASYVLFDI